MVGKNYHWSISVGTKDFQVGEIWSTIHPDKHGHKLTPQFAIWKFSIFKCQLLQNKDFFFRKELGLSGNGTEPETEVRLGRGVKVLFWDCLAQVGDVYILLLVQKSGEKTTWDIYIYYIYREREREMYMYIYKPIVNNGINYQPQLVIAGFLNYQQYYVSGVAPRMQSWQMSRFRLGFPFSLKMS